LKKEKSKNQTKSRRRTKKERNLGVQNLFWNFYPIAYLHAVHREESVEIPKCAFPSILC
jgi:hypothetical protein